MRLLREDIEHFARRKGLRKGVEAAAVLQATRKVLPSVLPSTLHDVVIAESFTEGVLTLRAPSGSALQTIFLYKPTLLNALKKHLGRQIVERVVVAPLVTND